MILETKIKTIVFRCDNKKCLLEYERKKHHRASSTKFHYCCRKCCYASKYDNKADSEKRKIDINCDLCGMTFRRFLSYVKDRNFCSRDCLWNHKHMYPECWPDNSHAMNTKEAQKKARVSYKEGLASGRIVHSWIGKHHSEESKQKISRHHIETGSHRGERNAMFGKKHSDESRSAMSDTRTKKWIEGKYKSYGKNNHDTGNRFSTKMNETMHYRSSWEKACMEYLDAAPDVSSFQYEKMRLAYYDTENNKRHYIPDFFVTYLDGRTELWEIKPKQFLNTAASKLKTAAAEEWCRSNNSKFVTVTLDDLISRKIVLT